MRYVANDAHTVASGAGIYAGRGSAVVPSWVQSRAVFEWYAIPGTSLQDDPDATPSPVPPGNKNFRTNGYNGAAVRHAGSHYILADNGGHGDYAGNEVVAIQLESEAPSWYLKRTSSATADMFNDVQFYADHRPAATHTYNATRYCQQSDKLVIMPSGGMSMAGLPARPTNYPYPANANNMPFVFDWAGADWHKGNEANYWAAMPATGGDWTSHVCAIHPDTDDVYMCWGAASNWLKFSVGNRANPWTLLSSQSVGAYRNASIDPTRNRMLVVGSFGGTEDPMVRDLTGASVAASFGGLGASALRIIQASVEYVPPLDSYIVVANGQDGFQDVWQVHAGTLVVSKPTVTGTRPPNNVPNGVRNFAKYVPNLKGIATVAQASDPVYFLKLAN